MTGNKPRTPSVARNLILNLATVAQTLLLNSHHLNEIHLLTIIRASNIETNRLTIKLCTNVELNVGKLRSKNIVPSNWK